MSKKVKGYFIYQRKWDFSEYSKETMEKYGLTNAVYYYFGHTKAYNLKARCSKWRWSIKNKKNVAKSIIDFIGKVERFYREELNYTEEEIKNNLYYNARKIGKTDRKDIKAKRFVKTLERNYISKLHSNESWNDICDKKVYLISHQDSYLEEISDSGLKILRLKKGKK